MAVFTLRVRSRFDAAHHLSSYHGKPEESHGHTFRVEAALEADELDAEGLAFDFVAAKRALDELAAGLDHRDVNDIAPFDRWSPTTEHLAVWFQRQLAHRLPTARITEVTVWEGSDCAATYRPAAEGP